MFQRFTFLLVFGWINIFTTAQAIVGDPTWGFEFTFTNSELIRAAGAGALNTVDTDASRLAQEQWKDKMAKVCSERVYWDSEKCSVSRSIDKYGAAYYRVQYNDGFYYNITLDPYVIEVTGSPLTIPKAQKYRARIQKDIFDMAKSVVVKDATIPSDAGNLVPHIRIGNGHLHLGKTAFMQETDTGDLLEDPELLLRFMTDYFNHPTLGMGALGVIPTNAPPLGILSADQRLAYQTLLTDFAASLPRWSIQQVAAEMECRVYTKTWCATEAFAKFPLKYQAINTNRLSGDYFSEGERTIEIRGNRPQRSADDFIQMIELYEARLKKLDQEKGPIHYRNNELPVSYGGGISNPKRVLGEFFEYVTTAGLDWDAYQKLLSQEQLQAMRSYWVDTHHILVEAARYSSLETTVEMLNVLGGRDAISSEMEEDFLALVKLKKGLWPAGSLKLGTTLLQKDSFQRSILQGGLMVAFAPETQERLVAHFILQNKPMSHLELLPFLAKHSLTLNKLKGPMLEIMLEQYSRGTTVSPHLDQTLIEAMLPDLTSEEKLKFCILYLMGAPDADKKKERLALVSHWIKDDEVIMLQGGMDLFAEFMDKVETPVEIPVAVPASDVGTVAPGTGVSDC